MKSLALSFYPHCKYTLINSYIDSPELGTIILYNSLNDVLDWGDVKNYIEFNNYSDAPHTLEINYKYKESNTLNTHTVNFIPSAIKSCLLVGFAPNDIVLWDCLSYNSVIYKYIRQKASNMVVDNWMKQYTYRYIIYIDNNNFGACLNSVTQTYWTLDYIEEKRYDGTYDKLNDGGLLKYHQAGKPKKLAIKWHIGKSEYSAYFWFEEEPIREVFDIFFGAHPDTKTDFIIRIDAENKKYELALYRYGLKEPQVIPENVYQLLVFKNKFEDYRSDNYNQERGAWIW